MIHSIIHSLIMTRKSYCKSSDDRALVALALECIGQPCERVWCRGDGTSCAAVAVAAAPAVESCSKTKTSENKLSSSAMERSDLKRKLKCRLTLDSSSSCDGVADVGEVGANVVVAVVVVVVAAVAAAVVVAVAAVVVGDKLQIELSAVGVQLRRLTAGWTGVKRQPRMFQ